MEVFTFHAGDGPLLVSIPHAGTYIPESIKSRMTVTGKAVPDTDWFVDRLYKFLQDLNIPTLAATHSRYVVDLNRSSDDKSLYPGQFTIGLFPDVTFKNEVIYMDGEMLEEEEKAQRIRTYWRPYHDKLSEELNKIREKFGYALLWDAHSIKSQVPAFFAGCLPDLNFGTNNGKSCALDVKTAFAPILDDVPIFTHTFNDRFRGGFITRYYGKPADNVHALQLELAQITYMDEEKNRYNEKKAFHITILLRKLALAYQKLKPEGM